MTTSTSTSTSTSTPYRHLLCPVDFSEVSRMALEWAVGFAGDVGGRITVLHVLDTPVLAVGNLAAVPDVVRELRQRSEEEIARWQREIDLSHARVELDEGAPAESILAASSRLGADLVVMGTHGLSGFQKLLLGSVTEKVLHRLRVPLVTLSPEAVAAGEAGAGGGPSPGPGFVRPRTIVMGVDFGDEASAVIRQGLWLAEHYRATLVAVHAVPVPYVVLNDKTLARLGPRDVERLQDHLTADRREELEALLPESTSAEVHVVVRVGTPFETLRALALERSADLVVMGAGGHGEAGVRWLGSTCHKVVRSAVQPVLIVR